MDDDRHDGHGAPSRIRKDVIIKAVIRDMRKYYKSEFNALTGFISRGKGKKEGFYRECLVRYLQEKFPSFLPSANPTPLLIDT